MNRWQAIKYTWKHRQAFKEVEYKLLGDDSNMWIWHDLEKLLLYPIFGKSLTSKIHRWWSRHHVNSFWSEKRLFEMAIDWECARKTKSDKPLNARQTMEKYYPEMDMELIPVLIYLGIF